MVLIWVFEIVLVWLLCTSLSCIVCTVKKIVIFEANSWQYLVTTYFTIVSLIFFPFFISSFHTQHFDKRLLKKTADTSSVSLICSCIINCSLSVFLHVNVASLCVVCVCDFIVSSDMCQQQLTYTFYPLNERICKFTTI